MQRSLKLFIFLSVIISLFSMTSLVSCQDILDIMTDNNNRENDDSSDTDEKDEEKDDNVIFSFSVNKGEALVSSGWGDMANNGTGLAYADAQVITWITDGMFPESLAKRQTFTNALKSSTAKIIVVSGDIDLSDGLITDNDKSAYDEFDAGGDRVHEDIVYPVGSNTTIVGIHNARIMFGGLEINNAHDIIIRNIHFYDAYGSTAKDTSIPAYEGSKASIDGLQVMGNSSGIWVDHCTFSDGTSSDLVRNYHHDGSFDIKSGINITVSYCEFTNHDKVMLIGSNDTSYTNPEERKITLHHNWFHGTTQRMPRSRGTYMHIYNNIYENIGNADNSGYSLGPGIGSQYIVQNNWFGSHASSIIKYYDKTQSTSESTFSRFYHDGNSPPLSAAKCAYDSSVDYMKDFSLHESPDMPWIIPYAYSLQDPELLKTFLREEAGSGKKVKIEDTVYE